MDQEGMEMEMQTQIGDEASESFSEASSEKSVVYRFEKRDVHINTFLILFYYVVSFGTHQYTNWAYKKGDYRFSMYVYMSVVSWILSVLLRICYQKITGKETEKLSCKIIREDITLLSFVKALSIVLYMTMVVNELEHPALHSMTDSVATLFVLFFALIMLLEKLRFPLIISVIFAWAGHILCVYGSLEKADPFTFLIVFLMMLFKSMQWTLIQFMVQKANLAKQNPLDLIFYIEGIVILFLFPFVFIFDLNKMPNMFNDLGGLSIDVLKVSFFAILMFLRNVLELSLLGRTSAVSLCIIYIFGQVCASLIVLPQCNINLMFGSFIALVGIGSFFIYKLVRSIIETSVDV